MNSLTRFQPRPGQPAPRPRPGPPPPKLPQRCTNERPHAPHPVRPRRRNWTSFHCPGLAAGELDRLLVEAFGPALT